MASCTLSGLWFTIARRRIRRSKRNSSPMYDGVYDSTMSNKLSESGKSYTRVWRGGLSASQVELLLLCLHFFFFFSKPSAIMCVVRFLIVAFLWVVSVGYFVNSVECFWFSVCEFYVCCEWWKKNQFLLWFFLLLLFWYLRMNIEKMDPHWCVRAALSQ